MKVAILGWGSLLWDKRPEFDSLHDDWKFDGPALKIEFSRVSKTRKDALTLVLDKENGELCNVAYSFSSRKKPYDAICDLTDREGTVMKNIGFWFSDSSCSQSRDKDVLDIIKCWALNKKIDVVIWTDLLSNFNEKSKNKKLFSVKNAIDHLLLLDNNGRQLAKEYICNAPEFVKTPLRREIECKEFFYNSNSI
mgnify:CR=1 FL=1